MYCNKYLIAFLFTVFKCIEPLELRGVTVLSPPFVMRTENDQFEGYAIDLLNEMARIIQFNYTLYPSIDDMYGPYDSAGKPTGLINEVFMRRADFAIADLTKSQARERFVDFTDPFMTMGLSALISKANIGNMTSFEDLVNQTSITYGVIKDGATYRFISSSPDSTIQRMYGYIFRNMYNLVKSRQEGIERAINSNYAFIQESIANDYARDQNCELTVIDAEKEYPREYAIALQKLSPYLNSFNEAIRQLKDEGVLEKLKEKYFRTKCLVNSDMMSVNAKLDFITFFSLILSALVSIVLFH